MRNARRMRGRGKTSSRAAAEYLSAALLVSALASGCATLTLASLNEGQVDYFKVTQAPSATSHLVPLRPKYDPPTAGTTIIDKGEVIAVSLRQGFILQFTERWERFRSSLGFGRTRGEIVVLAQVFELGTGQTAASTLQASKKAARVIYYSEDVRWGGQFFNFSNIPVYGPTRYGGRPLYVQLRILELDTAESLQFRALIKTLATLGSAIYPPASPVLGVLDQLGEALLRGEQDDSEFRYDFVLDATRGAPSTNTPMLEAGHYVLVKEEAIETVPPYPGGVPWSDLRYDSQRGRLVHKDGPDYLQHTYLVLTIDRGHIDIQQAVTSAFADLEAAILAQAAKDALQPAEIGTAVRTAITRARDSGRARVLLRRYEEDSAKSPQSANLHLLELFEMLQASVKETDAGKRTLTDDELDFILRKLRGLARRTPEQITVANLKTMTFQAFQQLFAGS